MTQLLSKLLRSIDPPDCPAVMGGDPVLAALTADSRQVLPGALFAALPGVAQDGRSFIADALARGATAILTDRETTVAAPSDVAVLRAADPHRTLALLAAAFFGPMPGHIAAVTGTNGKTSTAQFVREIMAALGNKAASIGTLGVIGPAGNHYGTLTTPDAITLHRMLAELAAQNVTHAALEASSHGLVQRRLDGVRIEAAGFTNLTRDHLDFHGTMGHYFAAKARLFDELLLPGGTAVLNADTTEATSLAERAGQRAGRILTYGAEGRDLRVLTIVPHTHGQRVTLEILGQRRDVELNIVGRFQVWNALCALGLCIGLGADPEAATAALPCLTGVRGRLEQAATHPGGAPVFIDYAHTPDALETVLRALRPHVDATRGGRLLAVFGCGGNRDKGKRPIMGGIAQRLADVAIVTDDNPRFEDAAAIRAEILAGCQPSPPVHECGDRHNAIRAAIKMLHAGDILVIAGKGHEPGQIVRDQVLPFDDAQIAREFMEEVKLERLI